MKYTQYVAFCVGDFFFLAMDAFTRDKWILLATFLLEFISKLSGKHFTDHALEMYRLISPHCLYSLP